MKDYIDRSSYFRVLRIPRKQLGIATSIAVPVLSAISINGALLLRGFFRDENLLAFSSAKFFSNNLPVSNLSITEVFLLSSSALILGTEKQKGTVGLVYSLLSINGFGIVVYPTIIALAEIYTSSENIPFFGSLYNSFLAGALTGPTITRVLSTLAFGSFFIIKKYNWFQSIVNAGARILPRNLHTGLSLIIRPLLYAVAFTSAQKYIFQIIYGQNMGPIPITLNTLSLGLIGN